MGTLWGQVQKSPKIGQKMSENRSDKGPKIVLNPPWKNCLGTWHMAHGTCHMAHGTWHMAQFLLDFCQKAHAAAATATATHDELWSAQTLPSHRTQE